MQGNDSSQLVYQEIINKIFKLKTNQLIELNEYIEKLLNPKKKRSLSQNGYLWLLVNEIGNKVGKSKEEVYEEMLKNYGQRELISMLSSIDPKGYIKYYEEFGKGVVKGKEFTHYKMFKGSSEYNTLEMKYLLDGVIHEAEQLGIPTLSDEEISKMRLI